MRQLVKDYYGKILKSSGELKTNACCLSEAMPAYLKACLEKIHPEILNRFYGCGSPIPFVLEGRTVLDLGCGTGRDVYLLSQLVGPKGQVIGVDMTEEPLKLARAYQAYHTQKFGYQKSNIEFVTGYIEDLKTAGIADESVDVVVSNCVINLSPDKEQVFREIFRVLKPGGELCFSDVFAGRRVPAALRNDPVLIGECLGGALYTGDFRRMIRRAGCSDYRTLSRTALTIKNGEIREKLGMIDFYSMTIRAFKLDLEDACEDYGHIATYRGTIQNAPHCFVLDDHHVFERGIPYRVCGNTALMLGETRYREHFDVRGDFSTHYGLFDCGEPQSGSNKKDFKACC